MDRLSITIHGQVQGVGFRPHVYKLANRLGLSGFVRNNGQGVLIEVQGELAHQFIPDITKNLPRLARIHRIDSLSVPIQETETEFLIIESKHDAIKTNIAPDTCICSDCLDELFDPECRYFQYPFLNCTHCGPRYTITQKLPYDRDQTSMKEFPLCPDCLKEYQDPENRRFHAQAIACPLCGPKLSHDLRDIALDIRMGKIIALKGLGGYQLVCDARNEFAIKRLRENKNRESKPLALMVLNSLSAQTLVHINKEEKELLESPSRPIVLLKKKEQIQLSDDIAKGLNTLGIMLPSTPIHYLLFHFLQKEPKDRGFLYEAQETILVVTSANPCGEPIIIKDEDAQSHLHPIADRIVSYNRAIISRVDDSVLRIINHNPVFIRRARGYVPNPIELPYPIPPTLALGGHLKNTICITRDNEAFVSQHIGNLTTRATCDFFHQSIRHVLHVLNIKPDRIAHDLHPDFYSTQYAGEFELPTYAVQHHHAHLASVIAEHALLDPVLGLALDGYGYGPGGQALGGELYFLDKASCTHIGSFEPLLQPGAERAVHEPWRIACAALYQLGRGSEIIKRFSRYTQARTLLHILDKQIHCPPSSSCGRLFDAASALLGVQEISEYEGQAAMCLESVVTQLETLSNGWRIKGRNFDMHPTLDILADLDDPIRGANLFHGTLITGLATWIESIARELDLHVVVLSGGCFLNQVLSDGLTQKLDELGLQSYLPRLLPPNDGGISLGQAWIAGIS